jgi:hypothetical protein
MMRVNGVIVYVLALVAWSIVVVTLVVTLGWHRAADAVAVPVGARVFGDMRMMLDGFDAANRGEEVLWSQYQARNYFPIRFPYHRAWLVFRHVGVTAEWNDALSAVLAVLVLAHFAVLIAATGNSPDVGFALAAFAASPFMMLGFERGNPDLFLYLLLAAGCHLLIRSSWTALILGSAVVFFAGVLKFVPFGALLGVLPGDRTSRRTRVFAAAVGALVLFAAIDSEEVVRVATSPIASSNWAAFGAVISVRDLERMSIKLLGLTLGSTGRSLLRIAATLAVLIAIWRWSSRLDGDRVSEKLPPLAATGFVIGGAIFVSSFIMISSYQYKIMFLAPAVPALVIWGRRADSVGIAARIAGITLLIWLWSGLNPFFEVAVHALIAWPCVAALGALLVASLKEPGLAVLTRRPSA